MVALHHPPNNKRRKKERKKEDRRAVVAARRLSVCWPQPHDQRLAKLANQTYPGGCAVVANQALLAVCRRDLHGVLVECVLAECGRVGQMRQHEKGRGCAMRQHEKGR
eukprot:359130-Chlamydomonas_euryale.AAC.1